MIIESVRRFFNPVRITVTSFLLLIFIGVALLSLPFSVSGAERLGFVNALFISTSAVCVTGLSPIDISREFSIFGQIVVLILVQIGGLGLMTFTTVAYYFIGWRLPIINRVIIETTFHHKPTNQLKKLIKRILIFTFGFELIGFFALFLYWLGVQRFESAGQTAWFALFHSVAAFTNAGFSLFSDNLIGFKHDFFVQFVITTLTICGGIGFLVAFELEEYIRRKFFAPKQSSFVLSVQTKLALVTTFALIVVGTVLIFVLERSGAFAGFSTADALMNSYFFSIVTRTAGFNTMEMSQFGAASLMIMIVLMFIGASPGSTAGGVKTITFGLLIAYTISRLRGEQRLNIWNRTVPQQSIDKAGAVVVAAFATVIIAVLFLMLTETRGISAKESRAEFLPILFETVSAFGTVGLSLDFTNKFSDAGKVILSIVMFAGRVGVVSLALAIGMSEKKRKFSYAEETVMIG